ncbi:MAG: dethiobiotin synthase [Bacteroidota bacterium]
MKLPSQIFVTGTDTGIGKTVIAGILTQGLNAHYWKPVQSGLDEQTDSEWVADVIDNGSERVLPERYRLNEPMSPHASAEIDGVEIGLHDFMIPEGFRETDKPLIVEGAGGIHVPLNDRDMMVDLMRQLGLPVLVVARSTLGTLNHTLLTIEALRSRTIPVLGIVLNGPQQESNQSTLQRMTGLPVLGPLPEVIEDWTPELLQHWFEQLFETE